MSELDKIALSTSVKAAPPPEKFGFQTAVAGIGSCFAEKTLSLLGECGMTVCQNPSGIVYNAHSMAEIMQGARDGKAFSEEEFFLHEGRWRSWLHHGDFSAETAEAAADKANSALSKFKEVLTGARLFVATPASSVVYEHIKSGRIVANCHKVPGNMFKRRTLSAEENRAALAALIRCVQELNPDCLTALTLSPVRHYPGDLVLNSLSKARLLCAIHECAEEFGRVVYFPSYEIMNDELRDYRFYSEDMLHPSETAFKIIFKRFIETFFTEEAADKIKANMDALRKAAHRPRL